MLYVRKFYIEIKNEVFFFFFLYWRYINQIDQDKAAKLAEFEKDLNYRQEQILEAARKRIDSVNEEANRLKMVSNYSFICLFFLSIFFHL
jgi:hypothetical protein